MFDSCMIPSCMPLREIAAAPLREIAAAPLREIAAAPPVSLAQPSHSPRDSVLPALLFAPAPPSHTATLCWRRYSAVNATCRSRRTRAPTTWLRRRSRATPLRLSWQKLQSNTKTS